MSLNPRPYQHDAITSVLDRFNAGEQRTLVVCPTGGGKTVIAAHVGDWFITNNRGRILILAHRDELIRQAAEKFEAVTGIQPVIEKGDEFSPEDLLTGKPKIVVSSFQTQNAGTGERRRMHRFEPKDFGLVWIDEAHHILAESYRRVLSYYADGNPDLKVLGVTATADRADRKAVGQVFQSCAHRYELPDAVRDGYLVPIRQRSVVIEGLDFSKVRTSAGDLNAQDLEAAMMYEKPLHGIVHATIEVSNAMPPGTLAAIKDAPDRSVQLASMLADRRRRQTLIFTVTVAHAERMAEILNRWIPESAASIDGAMPLPRRQQILRDYREGRLQFLVNCMVASEGFDEPGIEVVVMARPTKSRALYTQQIGRGTRPLAELASHLGEMIDGAARRAAIESSAKPYVEILDFVGNAGKHKLITSADVLGGRRFEPEVIERANELAQEESIDVEEALHVAEEEVELEREASRMLNEKEAERLADEEDRERQAEAARRVALVATTNYDVREVDAFDPYAVTPERLGGPMGGASEGLIGALMNMGLKRETVVTYSAGKAGAILSSMRAKKCSIPQANWLRKRGYNEERISRMNFRAAKAEIDKVNSEKVSA